MISKSHFVRILWFLGANIMTKNEVKKMGRELAQYIMGELESYDLDFNFDEYPYVQFTEWPHEVDIILRLWGYKIPEDVEKSDEEVLTKFLEHMFNKFKASYDINYRSCEYDCYIHNDTNTVLFVVKVYNIKIKG